MTETNKEFKVKIHGARGSYPVCSADKVKYGGNTSCVEIRANGKFIILDAGTGIINVGSELVKEHIASGTCPEDRKPIEAVILFSHTHLDHIQGFPFFKPSYIKTSRLYMYGFRSRNQDFETVLAENIFDPIFPIELREMSAKIKINNFRETDAMILYPDRSEPEMVRVENDSDLNLPENAVLIKCLKSFAHPKDGVLLYKIACNGKSMVYASDKEGYVGGDSKLTAFARNTDLLIHDAQYTMEDYTSMIIPKQGYGHSTTEMAVEAAKLANAGQLVLFHLDPGHNDEKLEQIEARAKGFFKNTITAYEGLEIDLMQTKCQV